MKVEKQFLSNFLEDLNQNRVALPTLPEVAVRVRKLAGDPMTTARQLARLINTDAALTARLLKVVNSPMYRGPEKIENVQTAITRIGAVQIRNLVMSLVMQQLYDSKGTKLTKQRLKDLWTHGAKVATLSYVIAKRFTALSPDQALLAGLIHDIGVLPILRRAEAYPGLMADPEALEEVIKHLHTIIGPFILEEWGFSPELVAVAGSHEDMWCDGTGPVTYTDVVIIANLHSYVGTHHRLNTLDWAEVPAFAKLGLTPEQSIATLETAREELQEVRSLFV